jgi:2C-methyl-D-erythritol 2,4-cyclodiphosphate synthase
MGLDAMGKPDIGHYFPPGDPSCKDICSLRIHEKCRELLAEDDLGDDQAGVLLVIRRDDMTWRLA